MNQNSENRIVSFTELETALNDLTSLAEEIKQNFNNLSRIHGELSQGWASANSKIQLDKMVDYQTEALKIAQNVAVVSNAIQQFKTKTREVDAQ